MAGLARAEGEHCWWLNFCPSLLRRVHFILSISFMFSKVSENFRQSSLFCQTQARNSNISNCANSYQGYHLQIFHMCTRFFHISHLILSTTFIWHFKYEKMEALEKVSNLPIFTQLVSGRTYFKSRFKRNYWTILEYTNCKIFEMALTLKPNNLVIPLWR